MREYVSCKIEVEFPDGDIDVIRVDTQVGVETLTRLLKSLSISRLERHCLEKNHHDKIQTPYFVCLTKAVNPPHLSFLVRIGEDAGYVLLSRNSVNKVFSAFLSDVLTKFAQKSRCPLLLHVDLFIL